MLTHTLAHHNLKFIYFFNDMAYQFGNVVKLLWLFVVLNITPKINIGSQI